MFGSDLPIETLRSSFADLCLAYDEVLRARTPQERREVLHDSAVQWLGTRSRG
jgi:predicted TIM-barrel fold metal-dependent hydrolase